MEIRFAVAENRITPERAAAVGVHEAGLVERLGVTHSGHCAEVDGRVVGFAMAELGSGWVWALFVRPEAEGRGIGSRLLEATLADLAAAGHPRARLSTEPGTRAFAFYDRRGWREVGTEPGGDVVLELELARANHAVASDSDSA